MRISRRRLLSLGALGVVGSAGCLESDQPTTAPDPVGTGEPTPTRTATATSTETTSTPGPVATAPIPESSGEFGFAVMGSPQAPELTYYGNWKCPACAEFSTGDAGGFSLGTIVDEYVRTGRLRVQFRCLAYVRGEPFLGPDSPRAARAGLAVWHVDPDSYWPFHEVVMRNQPPPRMQWCTTDQLLSFAYQAGVDGLKQIRARIETGMYARPVRKTTEAAALDGVYSTPALAADGKAVSPLDGQKARSLVESVAE